MFVEGVREHPVGREVERRAFDVGADEHGRVRARGVADAELVEDVRVRGRQVGDRVVGQDQPLEHRLVDHPPDDVLVGAQWLQLRIANRRRQQRLVDRVEIDRAAPPVGLQPERHDHEAQRRTARADGVPGVSLG